MYRLRIKRKHIPAARQRFERLDAAGSFLASSPDYEVVTTDYPAALQNPVICAPTVVFSSLLVWFLGGGIQAATWGKSPFCP
jgi:hypothetical protein